MKYSDCCGAAVSLDLEDYCICPACKEHCEYEEEEEDDEEDLPKPLTA